MTTKSRRIISLLSAAVLLLLTLLVLLLVLPRLRNQPIRIKTQLSPDEVADVVELSSGTLYFKEAGTIFNELTKAEAHAYAKTEWSRNQREIDPIIDGTFKVAELRYQLNIAPHFWRIPDICEVDKDEYYDRDLIVYMDDAGKAHCDDTVLTMSCRSRSLDYRASLSIGVGAAERRDVLTYGRYPTGISDDLARYSMYNRKWIYGELDSRIGDAPVSVIRYENSYNDPHLEAYMIVGNASYNIESYGISQQEFIELLISIYEAPHPVTQSLIDYLWEQTEAETTG